MPLFVPQPKQKQRKNQAPAQWEPGASIAGGVQDPGNPDPYYHSEASAAFADKWTKIMQKSFEDRGHVHGGYQAKGAGSVGGSFGTPHSAIYTQGLFKKQRQSPRTKALREAVMSREATGPSWARGRWATHGTSLDIMRGKADSWLKRPDMSLRRNEASTGWMTRLTRAGARGPAKSSQDATKEFFKNMETQFGKAPGEGIGLLDPGAQLQTKDERATMFARKKPRGAVRKVSLG